MLGFVLTFVLFIEPPVVSLAPRWSYVSTTRRSFAPQGANMSRVWGRHAPTRSLRKCRRIAEVKSRMDRKFSRIENLWPRDGSCPLPLRSKPFLGNCFRIVKAQKISRGCAAHVCGSPFAPNEVPAPVLQRRWPKSRYHARTAHEILKVRLPQKENTAHAVQAKDFVG